ncbi:MAG: hypothetical protein ACLRX5_08345 [Slackia sp.]
MTELWFMLASEAVSLVLAIVVASLAARGHLRPRSIPQWQALLVFFAGFLLSASGVLAPVPEPYSAALLGCVYGVASFLFCITWMEEFAYQDPSDSHKSMVAGLCIQTVLVVVVSMLPGFALTFVAMASAFISVLCHFDIVMRKTGVLGETAHGEFSSACEVFEPVTARAFVAKFGTAFACLFVLVGVVGILHTSVLGSSFEHIVGGVSMWIPLAFATAVTAVAGLAALRLPDPTSVYKAVLPVMLALLTLLPFVGDYLGSLAGGAMIACYDVCGMLFLFFIVDAAHGHRQQSYLLSSVYMGGSNGFLALGLGIGLLVNYLSGDYDISLMTLLAFVAMYPLGIAFVMVMRRSMQGVRPAADGNNLGGQAQAQRLAQDANPSSNGALGRHEQAHEDGSHGDESAVDTVSDSPDATASIPEERSEVFPVEPDWEAALHSFAERRSRRRNGNMLTLCAVVPQSVLPKSYFGTLYGRTQERVRQNEGVGQRRPHEPFRRRGVRAIGHRNRGMAFFNRRCFGGRRLAPAAPLLNACPYRTLQYKAKLRIVTERNVHEASDFPRCRRHGFSRPLYG